MARSASRPTAVNRRVSMSLSGPLPHLEPELAAAGPAGFKVTWPRTDLDLARFREAGAEWLPGKREAFVARAQAARKDRVFREMEKLAAYHCRVPGLVDMGWDRLDFHSVSAAGLADALRAAYEAGLAAGRSGRGEG